MILTPLAERLATLGLDLSVPFIIDTSRLRRELGYSDPIFTRKGIEITAADEMARGWEAG